MQNFTMYRYWTSLQIYIKSALNTITIMNNRPLTIYVWWKKKMWVNPFRQPLTVLYRNWLFNCCYVLRQFFKQQNLPYASQIDHHWNIFSCLWDKIRQINVLCSLKKLLFTVTLPFRRKDKWSNFGILLRDVSLYLLRLSLNDIIIFRWCVKYSLRI